MERKMKAKRENVGLIFNNKEDNCNELIKYNAFMISSST
jgi:hypothetical protein